MEDTLKEIKTDVYVIAFIAFVIGGMGNEWTYGDTFTMTHKVATVLMCVGFLISFMGFRKRCNKLKKMMK